MTGWNGYVSDTTAGSANQTWFASDGAPLCARVYYRLTVGGLRGCLVFSDVIDTTFADGTHSRANDRCGGFEILSLRVGLCGGVTMEAATEPPEWVAVTFDGAPSASVPCGGEVQSDPVMWNARAGQTLCVELTVCGETLPCHRELQIPSFVKADGRFVPSTVCPVPTAVLTEREAKRLCFLGDSITQGIGAPPNAYRHYAARLAEALPPTWAVWNLGVGFARSSDAAMGGVWLQKAMQNDAAAVCLGVNDLMQGATADEVFDNLCTVVRRLKEAGVRVLLQSVPPFDYPAEVRERWRELNARLPSVAADAFFDVVPHLCGEDGVPRYGGHPDEEGCAVWASALLPTLRGWLSITEGGTDHV